MRVTRAQAEANHATVIDVASREFRAHGFDGIGLKDVMQRAGLTPGGFYKRFESKEDLMAQASARAMAQAAERWRDRTAGNPSGGIERLVDFYLSPQHREERGNGCPLAALGADAFRKSPAVRDAFEAGILVHLAMLDGLRGKAADAPSSGDAPSSEAMATLATMVGALALSRMVNDPDLSDRLLAAAAASVKGHLRGEETGAGDGLAEG